MEKQTKAGAIYLFGIGLFLFFLGAGFCWLLAKSFGNASDTREWVETPCLIIRSEIGKRSDVNIAAEYRWEVAFKYQFEGEDNIGETYKPRGQRWHKSTDKVKQLLVEYPVDLQTVCFVNPVKPTDPSKQRQAILAHDTKAAGYSIWFPALFSVGGIGIMVGAVRGALK
ncbi:MAG: DUF3592 domain-containing protein [Rubritalea sp.]|uniref:DUF3592 domain-containing protein n=1 Tax=Rubritalea sp. TaxID=2109375 RepID=UPI003241D214